MNTPLTYLSALSYLTLATHASAVVITGGLDTKTTADVDAILTTGQPTDIGSDGWRAWVNTSDLAGSDFKTGFNSVGVASLAGGLTSGEVSGGSSIFDYAWTDGTPTASRTLGGSQGYINAGLGLSAGEGFEVPINVSGLEGTITLFSGVRRGDGRAVVLDSDDNVLYDSNLVDENIDASTVGSQIYQGWYSFDYSEANIGDIIRIQWVSNDLDNNAEMRMAAVAEVATVVPEPQTYALAMASIVLGIGLLRRTRA